MKKILVFTATYNEAINIKKIIGDINAVMPAADLLIIDDNSQDGTGKILDEVASTNTFLRVIHRPRKLGLGSAHSIAMLYAINNGYDILVTMDADLSHDPNDIPRLISALKSSDFVIGSRYLEGGSCEYSGYRKYLSLVGNRVARLLTGIPLHEFTTSFRAFKVSELAQQNFNWVSNSGYSFFLESLFWLHYSGLKLSEIPIDFHNRINGESKIPKLEIFRGISKLFELMLINKRLKKRANSVLISQNKCVNCGSEFMHEVFSEQSTMASENDSNIYKCSSMGHSSKPQVARCLQCNLLQVPKIKQPVDLAKLYDDVHDQDYLEHLKTKKKTFAVAYKAIKPFLGKPTNLLEIGSYCGLFLQEANKQGWQCTGIEPSKWAAEYSSKSKPEIHIINAVFEEAIDQINHRQELIVSWDVIEHVKDPGQMLNVVSSALNPGGIFAFSTLDINTWFPRLMGRKWPWLMDMHLYYFTPQVLEDMLNKHGMQLVHASTYRHYASIPYLYRKLCAIFLGNSKFFGGLHVLLPKIDIPISFGDVKIFIAKKC